MDPLTILSVVVATAKIVVNTIDQINATFSSAIDLKDTVNVLLATAAAVQIRIKEWPKDDSRLPYIVQYLVSLKDTLEYAKNLIGKALTHPSVQLLSNGWWLFTNRSAIDGLNQKLATKISETKLLLDTTAVSHNTFRATDLINDMSGRQFWNTYLGDQMRSVEWKKFFNALEHFYSKQNKPIHHLEVFIKPAVDYAFDDDVSLYEFDSFLQWFGPLQGSIERAVDLCQQKYFVPGCLRNSAEDHLKGREAGTFLVRWSIQKRGLFAVSYVEIQNGVKVITHSLIFRHANGVSFSDNPNDQDHPVYPSIPALVVYRSDKLKIPFCLLLIQEGQQQNQYGVDSTVPPPQPQNLQAFANHEVQHESFLPMPEEVARNLDAEAFQIQVENQKFQAPCLEYIQPAKKVV